MKFLRYGEPGREKPGILDGNGVLRDLSGQVDDLAGDVLARLDSLIEKLPTAINFFRILEARPALLEMLGNILSHAPVLANALARRAELFDGLIDATALDLPPSVEELAEQFARTESGDDYQILLDRVRARVGEKRFALGVQLIEGRHDALEISAGYARVAEAAIQVLAI